jgi:hypothetical protein
MCTAGGRPGLLWPLSGSVNLDALAPDSTLREEFEQWRIREGHFGGGNVSGHAATDLPARWSDEEPPPPRAAPAQSKRLRWALQRDGNHSAVGRRRRAALRSGAPPSRRGLITEKDGVGSIGSHVFIHGAPGLRLYYSWKCTRPTTPRRARLYVPPADPSLFPLRIAQRTRAHFTPKQWLLCHLGLY